MQDTRLEILMLEYIKMQSSKVTFSKFMPSRALIHLIRTYPCSKNQTQYGQAILSLILRVNI